MHSVQANRIVMIDIDTNGRMEERIPGTGQESWLDRGVPGLKCASEKETHWNKESAWHEASDISPSRW